MSTKKKKPDDITDDITEPEEIEPEETETEEIEESEELTPWQQKIEKTLQTLTESLKPSQTQNKVNEIPVPKAPEKEQPEQPEQTPAPVEHPTQEPKKKSFWGWLI